MQEDGNKRKIDWIIGIAMAAIILASIAAMVPTVSAFSSGGNFNYIDNTTANQKVLIGQNIEFNASWTTPSEVIVERYVAGDLANTYAPDANGRIYNVNWPTEGAYRAVRGTDRVNLSVSSPSVPLTLKIGDIAVSSIAVGTRLRVDTSGINLFDEDRVDLLIYGPDGKILSFNEQQFSGPTGIPVSTLKQYGSTDPALQIDTTGWKVGAYIFQIKTKPEYACGLSAESVVKNLTMVKGEIGISAENTTVIELETVKLNVTGVYGDTIWVNATPSSLNVHFVGGADDTPAAADGKDNFAHVIDEDGKRTYAVRFTDTGSYTIKVTVISGPRAWEYDTFDITVTEKAVSFEMSSTVVIGEVLMIRGISNTGERVDIAIDGIVYTETDDLLLNENGDFLVEIDTASIATDPGLVRLTAYINRAAGSGPIGAWEDSDGSTKIFMLNDAGGGIDISASRINVGKNESIILTIGAVPDHNVSVTTDDPSHTVFEYKRYDFTGTSKNTINRAPNETISIPANIGDCAHQAEAINIHGVWKTMDGDGIRKFEVHFTEVGTYEITATDYEMSYPTTTRLDEDAIEIMVVEKNVTFNVPSIVVIGEKFTINGTTKNGTYVTIAADDCVYPELDRLVIDENKQFSKEIDTAATSGAGIAFQILGWVSLKAYIDRPKALFYPEMVSVTETDDGSTEVLMVEPWLTANVSTDSVDLGEDFTITGTAKGSKIVDILIVSPKGSGGMMIDGTSKMALCPYQGSVGIYVDVASVSEIDGTFLKKITVGEDVDTGPYLVVLLSRGSDGLYGKHGDATLADALCTQYLISGKTQDEILSILDDIVAMSDDLMRVLWINVGPKETLTLNSIPDIVVGKPLGVTGTSSRRDGAIIWITVKGRYYEIVPQAAIVSNNSFSVTFDTTDAWLGAYTVKAIDGYGYSAVTSVNILMSGMINQPPIADFTYSPENPVVNEPIIFNASASYDPDGGTITNYEWNFGDGNITNTTEAIITHAYSSPGNFVVNLTVTDDEGATNTTMKKVTVGVENEVFFVPQHSVVYGGCCRSTPVEIWANATEFQGGQINLTYDPTCVNVTNWELNTTNFMLGGWSPYNGSDWITFSTSPPQPPLLTGKYMIGTLTLHCVNCSKEGCITPLDFVVTGPKSSMLFDDTGKAVNATWIAGTFECKYGICGDVAPSPDCDQIVNMGDVILLLNNVSYPENQKYVLCNEWAGNCRCTDEIDMGDVILLLNNVSYPENPKYVLDCC